MKKLSTIILISAIFCFLAGSQNRAAIAELGQFKEQAGLEERNKAIIIRSVEELNKGNTGFLEESLAPGYAYFSPSNTAEPLPREKMIETVKMTLTAFPDLNWSIKDLFAAEDRVIARFVITGTHKAEFYGIPATGNKIEYSSIVMCRIKDGKIVEEREEANLLGIMQQLNMELKPKRKSDS